MKYQKHLPGALLVAYLVYAAFVPATIAHSIILFSLASLCGFSLYLQQLEQPRLETELAKLKKDLEQQLQGQKEIYEARLQLVEGEQGRLAIERANASSIKSKQSPIKF